MMSKKVVLISIATGALLVASTAFAAATMPMVLRVGPDGRALLRGTVDSVSTSTLMLKSWGGDWTINISSQTRVLPQATSTSVIQQGDLVGVMGTVSQSASWTVDATLVRDWTYRQTLRTERQGGTSTSTSSRSTATSTNGRSH